jgi:Ni/Co efflux regulator RcnB
MNRQSLTACALALGFLAVSGRVAPAQDHNEQNKGQNKDQHGQSNAQSNQQQQARFRDEDRRATQDWYRQHHQAAPAGWRDQDRLPPGMQDRLRPGHTLDRDLRSRMHSLPSELSRRYAPPPRGYYYAVIGGNVMLLDHGYVIYDVFTITYQQQQARFRDEDRRATEDWYRQHHQQAPAGWRDQDRLPPGMQDRLRPGHPLDPDLRSRMHPLPSELSGRYAPPPTGYHYGVIGGNVVLLDNGYVVHDVFTITFQIH